MLSFSLTFGGGIVYCRWFSNDLLIGSYLEFGGMQIEKLYEDVEYAVLRHHPIPTCAVKNDTALRKEG